MRYDPARSVLAGMNTGALQALLTSAQNDYAALMAGNKVESASYAQGDGSRAITYTRANIAGLIAYIQQLQAQLGVVRRPRRPIGFSFR